MCQCVIQKHKRKREINLLDEESHSPSIIVSSVDVASNFNQIANNCLMVATNRVVQSCDPFWIGSTRIRYL